MREIIFRAKRKDNGEWVYGNLITDDEDVFVLVKEDLLKGLDVGGWIDGVQTYEAVPETVGQYTGLTDKNGTKIFEGDIVHWKKVPYFVRWDSKKAEFVFANDMEADYFVVGFNEHTTMKFCKVVGNIHDNPELLEE